MRPVDWATVAETPLARLPTADPKGTRCAGESAEIRQHGPLTVPGS